MMKAVHIITQRTRPRRQCTYTEDLFSRSIAPLMNCTPAPRDKSMTDQMHHQHSCMGGSSKNTFSCKTPVAHKNGHTHAPTCTCRLIA